MSLLRRLVRLVPPVLRPELKQRVKTAASPTGSEIVSRLYLPDVTETRGGTGIEWKITAAGRKIAWNRPAAAKPSTGHDLALPPHDLRMGYPRDDQEFLETGRRTADSIRRIATGRGVSLQARAVLEWGAASGRVIRHFADEAREAEFWGIDVDGPHINWVKTNLSPPFKFLTCTAYPHLPFEDNSFTLAYGVSIFTHMVHLIDTWLMEFRRILAPGAYAIFTIHDENTWTFFEKGASADNPWVHNEQFSGGLNNDVVVLCEAKAPFWGSTFTFFRTDWIAAEWSKFLDVVAIEPFAEGFQSAVVLQKPTRP